MLYALELNYQTARLQSMNIGWSKLPKVHSARLREALWRL